MKAVQDVPDFPSLTLAVDPEELNRRPSALHHGLRSLPVRTA